MFVEVVQNNGNYYIRLVQSVRGTNSKGVNGTTDVMDSRTEI